MKALLHRLWLGVRVHPSFPSYLHPPGPGGALSAPTDRNFCAVGSDGVDKWLLANRRGSHRLSAPAQAVLISRWGSCCRGPGGSYLQGRPASDGVGGLRPEGSAQFGDRSSTTFTLRGCPPLFLTSGPWLLSGRSLHPPCLSQGSCLRGIFHSSRQRHGFPVQAIERPLPPHLSE